MKKVIFTFIATALLANATGLAQISTSRISKTVLKQTNTTSKISNTDNIAGLKEALTKGIEQAVSKLSKENGFLQDSVYKLMLPPEAKNITNNIKYIPGGKELTNKTIVALNRSAEDAVKAATPIFIDAIGKMTIEDATKILFGANDAASQYLKAKTMEGLRTAFAPKVKASLDKALVAGVSTNQTWNTLQSAYNKTAGSGAGKLMRLKTSNITLENYATEKALEALFGKIAEQEKLFRQNPTARTTDLLKKVFGQIK